MSLLTRIHTASDSANSRSVNVAEYYIRGICRSIFSTWNNRADEYTRRFAMTVFARDTFVGFYLPPGEATTERD
jgi:hypothetical protein